MAKRIRPKSYREFVCIYCGMPAYTMDHFFPQSETKYFAEEDLKRLTNYDKDHLVPACYECNFIATNYIFRTTEQKRLYIQSIFLKRYERVLRRFVFSRATRAEKMLVDVLLYRLCWNGFENLESPIHEIYRRLENPPVPLTKRLSRK